MNPRTQFFLVIFSFLFLFSSCEQEKEPLSPSEPSLSDSTPDDITQPTISRGFYGFLERYVGDHMPGPGKISGGEYVQNEIYLFPKMTREQLKEALKGDGSNQLFDISKIDEKPLYIIKPNNRGFFQIDPANGEYSYMVKIDESTMYVNLTNLEGYVGFLSIQHDELIKANIDITYEASF